MPPHKHDAGPPDPEGNGRDAPTAPVTVEALIAEAEEVRGLLHDGYVRTSRLLAALKRLRRQNRLLESAVQSLRQLRLDR